MMKQTSSRNAAMRAAFLLSLGSALAPALARFSYALLLPPMQADLGWNVSQAGAMNTANAFGYLVGAALVMIAARQCRTHLLFVAGCFASAILMTCAGFTSAFVPLLTQRFLSGVSNAFAFIAGSLLAIRLASASCNARLVLGIYYGGAGWGVTLSALLVPATLGAGPYGWQTSWLALASVSALLSIGASRAAFQLGDTLVPQSREAHGPVVASQVRAALLAFGLSGVGYIACLIYVVPSLFQRASGRGGAASFCLTLGVSAMRSSFVAALRALVPFSGAVATRTSPCLEAKHRS